MPRGESNGKQEERKLDVVEIEVLQHKRRESGKNHAAERKTVSFPGRHAVLHEQV